VIDLSDPSFSGYWRVIVPDVDPTDYVRAADGLSKEL
jgi:hypothetical protein